ncbi:MAG: DUF2339 domain-containing protein, partial [Lysobacteraceae bacterium]
MEQLIALLVLAVLAVPVLLVVLFAQVSGLRARVRLLEDALDAAASPAMWPPHFAADQVVVPPADPPMGESPAPAPPIGEPPMPVPPPERAPVAPPGMASGVFAPVDAAPVDVPPRAEPAPPAMPARPDPFTLALRALRRWFTEGNVPVKVGVLVLFAGVAALLKYASDQGWMRMPPEFRLAGVALAALAGLVFGWRQRERRRGFALALQGGAIGVLLLVVFAAFKLLQPPLLPAGAAFALSVVLVAGCGVLAVRQQALSLAVLGTLAGFLAPLWLSTGQGSHVALFSYYALLDLGILAVAWFRPWRLLNLLGFVFTFGIGTLWGVLQYRPEHFRTTEPFLLLFFACYLLVPLLYARRRAAARRDLVDGCLVFGTPLVAFSLQAALLRERLPLAFCAVALAALYAALAWWLRRRAHYAALVAPYAVLAVGFATLAVPLALSAQATASVFALEGAALAWIGLRQQQRLPQLTGALLQLLAALALGWSPPPPAAHAVLNGACMGALLVALAGFASAWSYRRSDAERGLVGLYYLWGLAWWTWTGLHEVDAFVRLDAQPAAGLLFLAGTGWLAALAWRRVPARGLAWTTLAALASGLLLVHAMPAQPMAGWGALAWAGYALGGWLALRALRDADGAVLAAQAAWWLALAQATSLALLAPARQAALGDGWRAAALGLPWLALAAATLLRPAWVATPLGARFALARPRLLGVLAAVLALGAACALFLPGSAAPLPWLPLLSPLDLAQLGAWLWLARWLARDAPAAFAARRAPLLAVAGFALLTAITLRAAHHWGGVPWGAAMLSESVVQAGLTVVWSVLGVVGWILGSRRARRPLGPPGAVGGGLVLRK